jgi:hypothetical protein
MPPPPPKVRLSAEDVQAPDATLPAGGVAATRHAASDTELLRQ